MNDDLKYESSPQVNFSHRDVVELKRILNEESMRVNGSNHSYSAEETALILEFFSSIINPITQIKTNENN